MRVVVVTPPPPVVEWADADAHLALGGDTDQQDYVESLVAAATGHLDGPDGRLGRALGVQTLEARFDSHELRPVLRLPYPPLIEVVSVVYLDAARVPVVAPPAGHELLGDSLAPVGEWQWQGGYFGREAVRVRYRAGYEAIPPAIRAAILLLVGDLYRFRETATVGAVAKVPAAATVETLVAPFQVWR